LAEIITDWDNLHKAIENLKRNKKKIVFTNGCFDIIHPGHISYLKKAKSLGDILIIGLNSDSSIKRIKGNKRPIFNEKDRLLIISSFYFVDIVTIFSEDTPYKLINLIKPDILVKGGDWTPENIVGRDIVESYGGKVLNIPYLEGYSTTNIINKILSNCSE